MGKKGYTDLPWTKKNAPENVFMHEDRLEMPIRWTKPRRIFVNSMSDLFHEQVTSLFIDRVFAAMSLSPQHTFQILTKRPERMAEYMTHPLTKSNVLGEADTLRGGMQLAMDEWPLPNVWLGTSVEDQRAADERIPHLLRTPAAVRFLSCEPLLGPVELSNLSGWDDTVEALKWLGKPILGPDGISWVIVGGESGPNFRPMDIQWVRSIYIQCKDAGVAFFGKQDAAKRNEKPLPFDVNVREFPV